MRNRVLPMVCDWMMSPAGTDFRVRVTEIHMGEEHDGEMTVPVVRLAKTASTAPTTDRFLHDEVTLYFERQLTRMGMIQSSVNDLTSYDYSQVPFTTSPGQRGTERPEKFYEIWRKSGVCPNPGFYLVENSDWLTNNRVHSKSLTHHYLLFNTQFYLEFLTPAFAVRRSPLWVRGGR